MLESRNGLLYIGELPVTQLLEEYPDPLYVYDAEIIERKIAGLRAGLPCGVELLYSMKANPNASIVDLVNRSVDGIDISSLREMQVALRAGVTPNRLFFVGPSKSIAELEAAISASIGCLVIESAEELRLVDEIAARHDKVIPLALRVNPAFDAGGSRLKMGGTSRQFGIDEEQLGSVIATGLSLANVRIIGLHAYVGTRILDWNVALRNTKEILDLALRVRDRFGVDLRLVDVGGGFGVPYFPGEHEFDAERFASEATPVFQEFWKLAPGVRVIMELGRFLVADSGVYITRVRYVKTSRGQRYALVSGGMNHHQATTAVGSVVRHHFPIQVLNKMGHEAHEPIVICGPLCTPSDVLGRSVELPEVEVGDIIGILRSGAYGMTASPLEFLSHNWPNEVLVHSGTAYLIRRPPCLEDVLKTQPLVRLKGEAETIVPVI